MEVEEAEKLDTKEKKPGAKKADAGDKVKKGNPKVGMCKKRSPTEVKPCPGQRNWQIFLEGYVFLKAMHKWKYSVAKSWIETEEEKVLAAVTNPVGSDKKGGAQVLTLCKIPRYYPTEDVPPKLLNHNKKPFGQHVRKLWANIILTVLSGHHGVKRVVFLKQLCRGLNVCNSVP
ncbi:60S ribosomal protein L6 [Myotis brandtii]|uniref:60S ribosomal protein L6 n=1 Tax=Myotis brandtii TaxID=109478 RepID=S7PBP4_MYOBR|nr:60S ribosomal protein L6 [Myotis brandtii]